MRKLEVNFFGIPSIYIDGKKIRIKEKKVEALFFYLLIKKQCTRDELSNLLWGNFNEERAKRNLSNALYKLRCIVGKNIIMSKGNSLILINPDIKLRTDLSDFVKNDNHCVNLSKDIGRNTFLKNFNISNCEEFERWLLSMRNSYNNIFFNRYEKLLSHSIALKDVERIEIYANKIISIDPYYEKAYQILMKLYADKGAYNKAVELYRKLENLLYNDLEIYPNNETKSLFDKIIESKKLFKGNYKVENNEVFYGRFSELLLIDKEYKSFLKNESYKPVLIRGKAGVGKTRLIKEFLKGVNKEEITLLHFNFYYLQKEFYYKAFVDFIAKIADNINQDNSFLKDCENLLNFLVSNFNGNIDKAKISEIIVSFYINSLQSKLLKITRCKKIVIVLEDIHWMDVKSFDLLVNMLLQYNLNNLFFIVSIRDGYEEKIDAGIMFLLRSSKIRVIDLHNFSREEVGEIVGLNIKNLENNLMLVDDLYKKTSGNIYLVDKAISILKKKQDLDTNLYKNKYFMDTFLINIRSNEISILEIISIFRNSVKCDIIFKMCSASPNEIIDVIHLLTRKGILKEIEENNEMKLLYKIEALREYIYYYIPSVKRTYLHKEAAVILEKEYKNSSNDLNILSQLSYHYSKTDNYYKNAYYNIEYLEYRLNYCDEFFPTINNNINIELFIEKDEIYNTLEKIEYLLNKLKITQTDKEKIQRLYLKFYYLRGRTLIRNGVYEDGIKNVNNMIDLSLKLKEKYYMIHGYLEIIYYSIKRNDTKIMSQYINKLRGLTFLKEFTVETCVVYRLDGLLNIMLRKYDEAKKLLYKSIKTLEENNDIRINNLLNIAAAYNYLGDNERFNNNFDKALDYYTKAINICVDNNLIKGLDIFYKNYGQTAFYMGRYSLAEKYFKKSFKIYDKLGSFWERSIAEAYMALMQVKKGNYSDAIEYYNRAEFYSQKNFSPYELKILDEVKSEIQNVKAK